ncbi:MAG: amidohydrolase family protein [Actinomycetota bacterium]
MGGSLVGERYTVISADCHAGGNMAAYREFLDPGWRDEFDAWRGDYANPFRDLQGDGRSRNWDDDRRIAEQEEDGVVAEVVFPNTVPPFFPTGALVARPPTAEELPRRLAGIRAHNRWLIDFCGRHPERRAGIAQLFLNDLDEAIADVEFAAANGLRGGVLLPAVPADVDHIEPLYSRHYDPLWAACEELGVVVNHHSGGGAPDYGRHPATGMVWVAEAAFWSRRALTHLILGGVFERFPDLRLVLTEQGAKWIPPTLEPLDEFHQQAVETGRVGELKFSADDVPPLAPTEYLRRNVYVAASFPSPAEAETRHTLGVERFLWGSDYPHHEASWPYTRELLRRSFHATDPGELQQVLAGNAAAVYDFDLDALAPLAARVGPTVEEISVPLDRIPPDATSPGFHRP